MARPDYEIKANDTVPSIAVVLKQSSGTPIDLTTATQIRFLAKCASGSITGTMDFTADTSGAATFTPHTGDLQAPGSGDYTDYDLEFEITRVGGGIETVPNKGYHLLRIWKDLG